MAIGGGNVRGSVHAQHREIVVGRSADDLRAQHLAGCEPDRDRVGAFDDMIVGDDVAGLVPDEAGAGLRGHAFGLGVRAASSAAPRADDLHDGRRDALEQFDGRALELGQVAARLDRARGRGREEQPVDIGLRDIDRQARSAAQQ